MINPFLSQERLYTSAECQGHHPDKTLVERISKGNLSSSLFNYPSVKISAEERECLVICNLDQVHQLSSPCYVEPKRVPSVIKFEKETRWQNLVGVADALLPIHVQAS